MKLFTKTKKWLYVTAMILGISNIGNAQNLFEEFEDSTTNSYAGPHTRTLTGGINWQLKNAMIVPSLNITNNDRYNGLHAIRTTSKQTVIPEIEMLDYYANGADSVSFLYARYGSDPLESTMVIKVFYNTPALGTSWVQLGSDIGNLNSVTSLTPFKAYVGVSGQKIGRA